MVVVRITAPSDYLIMHTFLFWQGHSKHAGVRAHREGGIGGKKRKRQWTIPYQNASPATIRTKCRVLISTHYGIPTVCMCVCVYTATLIFMGPVVRVSGECVYGGMRYTAPAQSWWWRGRKVVYVCGKGHLESHSCKGQWSADWFGCHTSLLLL